MKTSLKLLSAAVLAAGFVCPNAPAQTDGSAKLAVTINDYVGASGSAHWTVAWVTTESGAFIKTLRKQGTSYGWTSSQWNSHCPQWNAARGGTSGSQVVDGYTSATATSYTGTNSPVILTWNCRDTNNVLVADGNYKFWVQYAEDASASGPYTTSGLLWTKGSTGVTNSYANQGANFTSMQVTWSPSASATVPPAITSAAPAATGTVGVPYSFNCTGTGTPTVKFAAIGLPTGLAISPAGLISGNPTASGQFNGTITATNGALPNATQPFAIVIGSVPVNVTSLQFSGNNLVINGTGPANGVYSVLTSTNANQAIGMWNPLATGTINSSGSFSFTNAASLVLPQQFYRVRVP